MKKIIKCARKYMTTQFDDEVIKKGKKVFIQKTKDVTDGQYRYGVYNHKDIIQKIFGFPYDEVDAPLSRKEAFELFHRIEG